MKTAPRAAFVITFSALAIAGCKKEPGRSGGVFGCKPPDCHINPPPPDPQPVIDAGTEASGADAAPSLPRAK